MTFETRNMQRADIPACVTILNHIIARGGSTAHEIAMSEQEFAVHYFDEPEVTNVVLHDGRMVGFQAAFEIEPHVFSIGSFTDQQNSVRGAGAALFAKSQTDCRTLGGTSIIAKITADNTGGFAYYSKMGFEDEAIWPADHTRRDGTTVDRVVKRFIV